MATWRKAVSGAVALGTAAAFIVPTVALAGPAAAATTATPIQHLVVIFQENVSFDHYFGTYPNASNTDGTPFTAKAGTPVPNGLTGGLLTANPNGTNPARYANSATAASPRSLLTCDQGHNYADEQTAFDGGAMDKFVASVGSTSKDEVDGAACAAGEVMNYYDGNTVTGLWNYAQQYAMSDNSYGTTFGPSAPGAVNLVAGDTGGVDTTGCTGLGAAPPTLAGCSDMAGTVSLATSTAPNADVTADGLGGLSLTSDAQPFYDDCSTRDAVALKGTNVGDELSQGGISWGWFQGGFKPTTSYATAAPGQATTTFTPDQFSGKFNATIPNAAALGGGTSALNQGICNAFHDIGADLPAPNTGTGQWGAKGDYIAHHEPFQYYATTANPHHLTINDAALSGAESLASIGTDTQTFSGGSYGSGTPNWDTANHQYDMSDFDALVSAIAHGQLPGSDLPAVSFLKAAGYEDGHAQYSDPIDEQNFITREINALMQTSDWPSTAVIISYDDSDGWYDHAFASATAGAGLVPINPSASVADNLFNSVAKPYTTGASGLCYAASQGNASSALASEMGRCGLGPRLPMLAVSCMAKANYIDHAVSDQSSVTKFIQGNWGLASIAGSFAGESYNQQGTTPAVGPLGNLFDFSSSSDTAGANGCGPYYLDIHTGATTAVPNPVLPDSRTPVLLGLSGLGVIVGFVAVRRRRSRRTA